MEWVLRSPQIHSTFGNLGFVHADGYNINENCNVALESILHNILIEDKYLRTYRRSISFGQNVKKDLIPLLIHTKDDKTIELLIRILVNLTIPIECLLSVDAISKTDFGRHTIFELNNLLLSIKVAFTDHRVTKVIIEYLKRNLDFEQQAKLSSEQCTNISNCLLLLRNILHIPEDTSSTNPNQNGPNHTMQNQILWNSFSQSIDKILIKLMTIPEASNWGVMMVQLIALLYKDQHVATLHKLLNVWLEASLSESSEDNESNTSPPDRGSEDSSPMLTSDPTSDSSDTGGSGKCNDELNIETNGWGHSSENNISENGSQPFQQLSSREKDSNIEDKNNCIENIIDETMRSDMEISTLESTGPDLGRNIQEGLSKNEKIKLISDNSDCGYGTQIENQESISTSSNEDELPVKKPIHVKPHTPKQRVNTKTRPNISLQERKRKKIGKRAKAHIINVHGLSHKTPTDDDISNVLKEFTVDFLLKGYNSLVRTLHNQILTNLQLEIDTSHFFWLVTYFLKFAAQIELDLDQVCSVLSFDIMAYLTAEGVNLCEQFELAVKLDGHDLKPSIRRLHLVVTAIRELIQAIEVYKRFTHVCDGDRQALMNLQIKISETEEFRSLLVLLLRHYNPKYHTKQYLQDLIVTNHILLMFLDNTMKLQDFNGCTNMMEHIKQFATPEVMYQYGLLLEDYANNGEFVNDCIFTVMHHVGGELDSLITLFQPKILKTFTSIWKSEFEICEDWSDLIEYVINTFIKKPHSLQTATNFRLDVENFDDDKLCVKQVEPQLSETKQQTDVVYVERKSDTGSNASKERWTEDELSSLTWNYMQCNTLTDVIGEIIKLFKEDGISKSRDSVIRALFKQNIINKDDFEKFVKGENDRVSKTLQMSKEIRDDEIGKLCEQLIQDGKSKFLNWVQEVLLDTCLVKIYLEKKFLDNENESSQSKIMNFELFKKKTNSLPTLSPVSYHSLLFNQSVPLVPWNCEQSKICKDLKFLQLLNKLGFHMPVDTGKVFIRIPHFWTPDILYEVAGKVSPINNDKLKFHINDICTSSGVPLSQQNNFILSTLTKENNLTPNAGNFYPIQKQKRATMVNFTPMPGPSCRMDCATVESKGQDLLKVMEKPQEYSDNITLDIESSRGANGIPEENMSQQTPISKDVLVDSLVFPPTPLKIPQMQVATVELAAVDSISTAKMPQHLGAMKHDPPYNVPLPESEDNNSVCDTASVASDLTRMYVSDEEEKLEVILPPIMKAHNLHEQTCLRVEHENSNGAKRPKLQCLSEL